MPVHGREIRDLFDRRSMRGLVFFAIFATVALIATARMASLDAARPAILSAAGEATAASQRIAFLANAYAAAPAGPQRDAIRDDLNKTIKAFREAHDILTMRAEETAEAKKDLKRIQPIYFGAPFHFDADVEAYIQSAQAVAASSPENLSPDRPPLSGLSSTKAERQFRTHLSIARELRAEAETAVRNERFAHDAIWITALVLILLEWLFLFRPIGLHVEESVEEIKKAEERTKKAAAAAELANASKSNFLRIISHEIRTPMNAVTGIAQLLRKADLPPVFAEQVRQLNAASEHLLSLANNVLDFSKLEAGTIVLQAAPFCLADELRRCADIIQPLATEKNLEFAVDIDETADVVLEGDAARLRQIVVNLLSNALKFTDRGKIALECSAVSIADGRAGFRLKISDTGVGISRDAQKNIFRSFEKLDAFESRRQGGAGIGLAIVAELIQAMDGSISVDSAPGTGSTFYVALSFPAAEPVAENSGSAEAQMESGPRRRVLVVEDNIPNQMIAKAFLNAGGFDVTIANNGQEALDAVAREKFDLVLMDINMPVMDGLEATRILRQNPLYKNKPILAFTAHALEEDQASLRDAGLDDVLKKPVTEKGLVERVRLWIANDNPADAA
ncbi:MAG: response regulator [Alphaproteobacteria bacterium]|nr:response regulator [Alphaproteobacteria bacterium]